MFAVASISFAWSPLLLRDGSFKSFREASIRKDSRRPQAWTFVFNCNCGRSRSHWDRLRWVLINLLQIAVSIKPKRLLYKFERIIDHWGFWGADTFVTFGTLIWGSFRYRVRPDERHGIGALICQPYPVA